MTAPPRQALIDYRLQQAGQSLSAARFLLQGGYRRDAINRAYYAMFYAALALLTARGKRASKHSGVLSLFDTEFVHPGTFDKRFSDWIHSNFDLRQDSDYREMFEVSPEDALEALNQAEGFVAEVDSYFRRVSPPGTDM